MGWVKTKLRPKQLAKARANTTMGGWHNRKAHIQNSFLSLNSDLNGTYYSMYVISLGRVIEFAAIVVNSVS